MKHKILVVLSGILLVPALALQCRKHNNRYENNTTFQVEQDARDINSEHTDVTPACTPIQLPTLSPRSPEEMHGPLAGACSDLITYYSYFIQHFMADSHQQQNRATLTLCCNTLNLMAHLADKKVCEVRLESYASDINSIISAVRETLSHDDIMQKSMRKAHPFIRSLVVLPTHMTEAEHNDFQVELGLQVYNLLRAQESAQILLIELFDVLKTYTEYKTEVILDLFQKDTTRLLDLNLQHREQTKPKNNQKSTKYAYDEESRLMRQNALLCQAAANTCEDIAQAMPQASSLKKVELLLRSLFTAMAVTYKHLSTPQQTIHRAERNTIASELAHMIVLLPRARKEPAPNKHLTTTYIDTCMQLSTQKAQERYIQDVFESPLDRNALLQEFFPLFEVEIKKNIELFSELVLDHTLQTLAERYWLEPVMQTFDE